jgi:hypothetical protein
VIFGSSESSECVVLGSLVGPARIGKAAAASVPPEIPKQQESISMFEGGLESLHGLVAATQCLLDLGDLTQGEVWRSPAGKAAALQLMGENPPPKVPATVRSQHTLRTISPP